MLLLLRTRLPEAAKAVAPLVTDGGKRAIVAATISSGKATSSLGCIGNRVYTDLPDGEFYVAIPGGALAGVVETLEKTVNANAELEKFHRSRCC